MSQDHIKAPRLLSRAFLLVLLVLALGLTFYVLLPLMHALVLAMILAILLHPIHQRLLVLLKGKRNLCALLMVLGSALVIVLPIALFLLALYAQAIEYAGRVNVWISSQELQDISVHPLAGSVAEWLQSHIPGWTRERVDFGQTLMQLAEKSSGYIVNKGAEILGNTLKIVTGFFIMIFLLFYLVRDGQAMVARVKDLAPLREEQEDKIFDKIRLVTRATLTGVLLTALLQGLVGGIGMSLVGIPGLFWGTIMGIASLLPVLGTGVVGVPGVVFMRVVGKRQAAMFLALWFGVVVGSIDNFVRPFLMRGKAEMSPFFIFLAMIGGITVYGFPGLLYGPLIMGFAATMLYIYDMEYKEQEEG